MNMTPSWEGRSYSNGRRNMFYWATVRAGKNLFGVRTMKRALLAAAVLFVIAGVTRGDNRIAQITPAQTDNLSERNFRFNPTSDGWGDLPGMSGTGIVRKYGSPVSITKNFDGSCRWHYAPNLFVDVRNGVAIRSSEVGRQAGSPIERHTSARESTEEP
jgi:hypothetical protein